MWARDSLRGALIGRLVTAFALIGCVAAVAAYKLGARYANLAYDSSLSDDVVTLASQLALHGGQVQVSAAAHASGCCQRRRARALSRGGFA
jgi:hypothetical protein